MSEIKRGDLVRVTTECAYQGLTGQVVWVESMSEWPYQVFFESETSGWFRRDEIEPFEADAPAPHDPADCASCDDHADATVQADRDEDALEADRD